MDDQKVQFQEYHVPRSSLEERPKMIEWILKHFGGIVKNEKQATYLLLGFFGLVLVIIIILLSNTFGSSMKLQPGEKTFFEKGGNLESYDKQIFKQ